MSERSLLPLIPILFMVLSLSCKSEDASIGPTVNADAIIPLAIGNEWVTNIYGWDSAGHPIVTLIDDAQIVRDTLIHAERWFIWKTGICVTNRSTGYWVLADSMPALFLRYPVALHDKYVYHADTVDVTSPDTTITVPAGTFHCACYSLTQPATDVVSELFFVSPNHGMIRRELYARTPGGRQYLGSRGDLVSHHLQ